MREIIQPYKYVLWADLYANVRVKHDCGNFKVNGEFVSSLDRWTADLRVVIDSTSLESRAAI